MAAIQVNEFDLVVHVVARSHGIEPPGIEQAVDAFSHPDTSPVFHRAGGVEYEIVSASPVQ